jgi:hypothetical protein
MKVRLCRQCVAAQTKTATKEMVMRLIRKGLWMCPFRKPQCGKILQQD